jgi:amphi-Trp domain-containing protein
MMMAQKDKVAFSGVVSAQEAAQYLESLAKGLREHSMLLESGDSSITVEVSDDLKIAIEVSADAEKGKASVDVAMSWKSRREEEAAPAPGLLIIPGAQPAEPVLAE